MNYSKIRKYIVDTVKTFDSDFKEHKDAFNPDNISKTNFNKGFFVEYSIPSIVPGAENFFTADATASVQFFFKGYRNAQSSLDDAMDTVGKLTQALTSFQNITAFRITDDVPIQKCAPVSQIPEPLQTNDNAIIINLELNLEIILSNC